MGADLPRRGWVGDLGTWQPLAWCVAVVQVNQAVGFGVYGRRWFRVAFGIRGVRFLVCWCCICCVGSACPACVALRCSALPCVRFVCSGRDELTVRQGTQPNAKQRTRGNQHQSHKYNTSKQKTENRSSVPPEHESEPPQPKKTRKPKQTASRSPRTCTHQKQGPTCQPGRPSCPSWHPCARTLFDALFVKCIYLGP